MQKKRDLFNPPPRTLEKNSGVSQTVPDQSLSIKQIMERHSRGIPIDVKTPQYHSEDELETIDGRRINDLAEAQEEMEIVSERIREAEKQRKEKQREESARKEQEQREQWKKEWEQELRQKTPSEAAEGRQNALA